MKKNLVTCSDCGNPRLVLAPQCPFCGALEVLFEQHSRWACQIINLESNMPLVDAALARFHEDLEKLRGKGLRTVKVIHGHGSSGSGGNIRREFRQAMDYGRWGDAIIEVYYGEILLPHLPAYKALLQTYPHIKNALTKDMHGNPGVTLLILDKNY